MDLVDTFTLHMPIDRAWALMLDLEKIAPCMPGAQLTEIEGDEHRGKVKIKVGPITAQFAGQARWTEKDEAKHRAVMTAEGREVRGQGNANAAVVAQLTSIDDGAATNVEVTTDLTISGKVAQFGRGVIADVSSKLISQFVANVEKMVNEDDAAAAQPPTDPVEPIEPSAPIVTDEPEPETPAAEPTPPADAAPAAVPAQSDSSGQPDKPTVRKITSAEPEPVDLLELTGAPVAKRLAPLAGIAALIGLAIFWRKRRSS